MFVHCTFVLVEQQLNECDRPMVFEPMVYGPKTIWTIFNNNYAHCHNNVLFIEENLVKVPPLLYFVWW